HRPVEGSPEEHRAIVVCRRLLIGVGLEVLGANEFEADPNRCVEKDFRFRRVELPVVHRCFADEVDPHRSRVRGLASCFRWKRGTGRCGGVPVGYRLFDRPVLVECGLRPLKLPSDPAGRLELIRATCSTRELDCGAPDEVATSTATTAATVTTD